MLDGSRLQLLSVATQAGLGAVALTSLGTVATAIPYADYLRSLPPRAPFDDLDLALSEAVHAMMGVAQLIASAGTAILFMAWFHRLYSNVSVLTGQATQHDPRWTIWGFLVPGLNLFRPVRIMRESWDSMMQRWLRDSDLPAGLIPRDLVGLWWGAFLTMSVMNWFVLRFSSDVRFPAEALFSTRFEQVSNVFEMGAAVVALLMVRNITSLQQMLNTVMPAPDQATS